MVLPCFGTPYKFHIQVAKQNVPFHTWIFLMSDSSLERVLRRQLSSGALCKFRPIPRLSGVFPGFHWENWCAIGIGVKHLPAHQRWHRPILDILCPHLSQPIGLSNILTAVGNDPTHTYVITHVHVKWHQPSSYTACRRKSCSAPDWAPEKRAKLCHACRWPKICEGLFRTAQEVGGSNHKKTKAIKCKDWGRFTYFLGFLSPRLRQETSEQNSISLETSMLSENGSLLAARVGAVTPKPKLPPECMMPANRTGLQKSSVLFKSDK